MAVHNPDATLAKLGSNLTFLKDWSLSNEQKFAECMEVLAEERPDRFAELFLKVQTMIAPPKETKTDININISKDFDKLQALAGTVDPTRRIEESKSATTYAPFEEIKS